MTSTIFYFGIAIVALLLLFGMALCLYRMLNNIIKEVTGGKLKKWTQIGCVVFMFCLLVLVASKWSLGLVWLLYFMGLAPVFALIDRIIKKAVGEKTKEWKIWNKLQKVYILPILFACFFIVYGYWNMNHVVKTDFGMTTKKEISTEGYRVALLADVHFGVSLDINGIKRMCQKISKENPDMILLCGDLVDENTKKEEMEQLFEALSQIENKYGIYYTYGNHDRQRYSKSPYFTEEELAYTIEKNKIKILQDEVVDVTEDMVLVGREDASAGARADLEQLYEEVNKNKFVLTMDHQPLEYKKNQELGTDLLVSGHTHAGQFFPLNLVMKVIPFGDAVYGSTKREDFMAFVTSGVAGWGIPAKTSAPAEYVMIEIKKEA